MTYTFEHHDETTGEITQITGIPRHFAELIVLGGLLTRLDGEGTQPDLLWVCRESAAGRGMRLHQTLNPIGHAGDCHPTAGEALADYFGVDMDGFLGSHSDE